jgi:C-terminal processing protease CtpA/Prc
MTTVADLTARLVQWLSRLMPADARTDALVRALRVDLRRRGRRRRQPGMAARDGRGGAAGRLRQRVRRLAGDACLIRIDGLDPLGTAQPYVDAAFALARGATGVVLDLRANGGGDPATAARIAGLLLGAATPGAADHITPIRLTAQVTSHLPEAYVRDPATGGNWEGRGVVPDVPCADEAALETAAARVAPGVGATA